MLRNQIPSLKPQGGPLTVINGVVTPIDKVTTPVTHLFSTKHLRSLPLLMISSGSMLVQELELPGFKQAIAVVGCTEDVDIRLHIILYTILLHPKNREKWY